MATNDRPRQVTIRTTTPSGQTSAQTWTGTPEPWPVRTTEARAQNIDARIRRIFREARDDLMMKQLDFLQRHEARVLKYKAQVEAGLLSKQDYEAWMRGQLFQQRQWELKRGQMARIMVELDKRATELINEGKLDTFADNADHMLFEIEQILGISTPFGLFNREAVFRLIREDPHMLPMNQVNEARDYQYYNEIIQNAVIQGILQGETIDEIARRVALETNDRAISNLRRNVRTALTGAQNAGALFSMRRARDELGIHIQKRWMATLDHHTRASHAHLDGQVQDIDDYFDSLLGPIMYPGDPDAEPENVWNCRCWMNEIFPEYDDARYRYDDDGEYVGDVSYEKWREMKGEG